MRNEPRRLRPVPEEDKKTTLELIDSLRILRADMATRREQLHTANNELFKTVGELSLAQIQLADEQRKMMARLSGLEGGIAEILAQAKDNGSKSDAAVAVAAQTSNVATVAANTSGRAVIENRVGVAVVSIVFFIIDYLSRHA